MFLQWAKFWNLFQQCNENCKMIFQTIYIAYHDPILQLIQTWNSELSICEITRSADTWFWCDIKSYVF